MLVVTLVLLSLHFCSLFREEVRRFFLHVVAIEFPRLVDFLALLKVFLELVTQTLFLADLLDAVTLEHLR